MRVARPWPPPPWPAAAPAAPGCHSGPKERELQSEGGVRDENKDDYDDAHGLADPTIGHAAPVACHQNEGEGRVREGEER